MKLGAIERDKELIELIEQRLLCAPIEMVFPIGDELSQICRVHIPTPMRCVVGQETCRGQTSLQVDEQLDRNGDLESIHRSEPVGLLLGKRSEVRVVHFMASWTLQLLELGLINKKR